MLTTSQVHVMLLIGVLRVRAQMIAVQKTPPTTALATTPGPYRAGSYGSVRKRAHAPDNLLLLSA